ncbi:MAG: 5-formyltetrahydrofolate cyclo-ligase [Pseudomonadota bacterium]
MTACDSLKVPTPASTIRRHLRQTGRLGRMRLRGTARRVAQRQIERFILQHPAIRRAQRIALYTAAGSEWDPAGAMHLLIERGKDIYLPQVRGRDMRFARHRTGQPLVRRRFGLMEPLPGAKRVPLFTLDVVVMPVVAFDVFRGRLGQGGGFYDRALRHRATSPLRSPYLIGVAFRAQRVSRIPLAPWDVIPDDVVHDTLRANPSS